MIEIPSLREATYVSFVKDARGTDTTKRSFCSPRRDFRISVIFGLLFGQALEEALLWPGCLHEEQTPWFWESYSGDSSFFLF